MAKVSLVPYGNASESKGSTGYNFNCQHGAVECQYNLIESCALNIVANKLQ